MKKAIECLRAVAYFGIAPRKAQGDQLATGRTSGL